jgi:hypothetical protein
MATFKYSIAALLYRTYFARTTIKWIVRKRCQTLCKYFKIVNKIDAFKLEFKSSETLQR